MNDIKLKELGVQLSNSIIKYKSKPVGEKKKIFNSIADLCYTYVYFFVINFLGEDDMASDFATYIVSKLETSINKWDENRSNFISYLNSFVSSSFTLHKLKHYAKNHDCLIIDDAVNKDIESFYHTDEHKDENNSLDDDKIKLKQKDKDKILAFILLHSRAIDEDMVENISKMLTVKEDLIRSLIEEVIERDGKEKEIKIEKEKQLRNHYYSKLLTIEKKSLSEPLTEKEIKQITNCKEKIKKHNAKISKLTLVSQKAVAETLCINYSNVRGQIFKAKQILFRIQKIILNDTI